MLASVPIGLARKLTGDLSGVRWTDAELLGWLNEGQRQIVAVRPDANAKRVEFTCVAGAQQTIPADGIRLLKVLRNKDDRAVTLETRELLDSFDPTWPDTDPRASIPVKHYLYDDKTPKLFDVFPPTVVGRILVLVYSAMPTDCGSTSAALSIDDIYQPALTDWICYRAWSKPTGASPGDVQRAANAAQTFTTALGVKTQVDTASKPTRE